MVVSSLAQVRLTNGFLQKVVAGAALVAVGVLSTLNLVQATEILPIKPEKSIPSTLTSANSAIVRSLPNGVYLYGQSPERDQIGSAYIVLQVNNQSVAGAFYKPSSSFDCFRGELRDHQLALTVTNSEEQTQYPYSLPLQKRSLEARTTAPPNPLIPAGYHAILEISERDRQILSTCQAVALPPK